MQAAIRSSTSMAAAGGGAPVVATGQQQQQQAALFASKHAELVSEARAVAREHGVNVLTVAFRPGGAGAGAVAHELVGGGGVAREERARAMIGRAVARDVSAMGAPEVTAHHRELLALRALVLRELHAKKEQAAPAAAAKDGDAGGKTKRAMEQHETGGAAAAAGSNKCRRTAY